MTYTTKISDVIYIKRHTQSVTRDLRFRNRLVPVIRLS